MKWLELAQNGIQLWVPVNKSGEPSVHKERGTS
jgi:hypothetical protein